MKKIKNIVYTKTEREYHTADIYLPKNGENFPLVIMIHGGAFQAGAKEMYDAWGPYLAQNGIASMSINYRLATQNTPSYPGLIQDVEDAINFVVLNAQEWKINLNQLGMMGDSAGGYLGTLAALNEERSSAKIKFVVSAYGVLDISDWAKYTCSTREDFVINKMFGKDYFIGQEEYKKACPMNKIMNVVNNPLFDTEFMMIWGNADEIVVPDNQTKMFIKKLEELEINYEEIEVPDYGHFWFTKNDSSPDLKMKEPLDDIAPKVVKFINRVVNKNNISDPTTDKNRRK